MLADGDALSCEVATPVAWTQNDPTLVLIHGLGGSSKSKYMMRLACKGYTRGIKVVLVNLRGCGSGYGLVKTPYSAASSDDIYAVLKWLKNEAPSSPVTLSGFSLGASIVIKLLGEHARHIGEYVKLAVAICPPIDLFESVQLIQQRRHYFYHSYYLKKVCRQARPWLKSKVGSLYEFDNVLTAPLWGFKNADDYYKSASCKNFLPKISVECRLLLSQDDPFIDICGLKNCTLSKSIQLELTQHGGHMGFLQKPVKGADLFWLDSLLFYWMGHDVPCL